MTKETKRTIIDRLILFCFLAIVFIVPIYFAAFQENFNIFELNKSIVFRFFLNIIIIATLVKYLFFEISFDFKKNKNIFFFVLFLASSFIISTIFSIKPNFSLWGSYNRQQGLYNLLYYLLFFVAVILNIDDLKKMKKIVATIIISSFFVCFYGLLQYLGYDIIDWKQNPEATGRIFSTLGQPNFFGQYLILVIPITAYAIFCFVNKIFIKTLLMGLFFLQIFCLLATNSRSSWLGFFAIIFLFFVYLVFVLPKKKKIFLFIVVFIISIFLTLSFFNKKIINSTDIIWLNRLRSITNISLGSNKIRLYYWGAGLKEFREAGIMRKIIGYGPETLMNVMIDKYRTDWGVYEKLNSTPDRTHNGVLDTLLQFGIMGFLAITSFILYIFYKVLIKWKTLKVEEKNLALALSLALVGSLVYVFFSFSLTVSYVYNYLFLGLLLALSEKDNNKIFSIKLNSYLKYLIIVPLVLIISILFYYYDVKKIIADHYFIEAKKAENKMNCSEFLEQGKRVLVYYPYEDFYKETYIYNAINCLSSIKDDNEKKNLSNNINIIIDSINQKERLYTTQINIAHAYSAFGSVIDKSYYQLAEKQYKELIAINPYITVNYRDYGKMKIWQGDYSYAIDLFMQGLKIMPDIDNLFLNGEHRNQLAREMIEYYKNLAEAHLALKQGDKAIEDYKQILKLNPYQLSIYKKIADLYYLEKDIDQALWYNKRGFMLNPKDYQWPYALSLLFRENGNNELALEFAQKSLELDNKNQKIINLVNNLINKKK